MIKNTTRGSVVAKGVRFLSSPLEKAIGLIGRRKVYRPLFFAFSNESVRGFHMFFVFCRIDMIFLDRKMQVVEILEGFRPFSTYTTKKPFMYALELEEGTIRYSKTEPGDLLTVKAQNPR